jgi:exonuclease SbcD
MIRILHTSDLHLGMENYGRPNPESGLSTRLEDFLGTLDAMVEFALTREVDLFLFCGDAYKNRDPNPTLQREFARRLARLRRGGVQVFLLVGNHDLPNALGRATAIEIFHTLEIDGVHIGDSMQLHRVPTRAGPLQVVSLPWVTRSRFLPREDVRERTVDEINAMIEERVARALDEQAAELDPGLPAVLAAHVHVSSATVGAERNIMLGHEYQVLKSTVAHPRFDYVALGHIHKHQALGSEPPVVYCGSSQRIDFSEENETKGFVLVEIDPTSKAAGEPYARWEFVPLPARRFVTVTVDANSEDPTETVLEAMARHDIADAVVRLHLRIHERNLPRLDDLEIRRKLRNAYYLAAFKKEIERDRRVRLGDHRIEALGPVEALKVYLETRETPEARAVALLERAQALLQEEREEER